MKIAKKRYFKREPDFWKILKGEPTLKDSVVGYKGSISIDKSMFYCPYIPLQHHTTNVTLSINGLGTRYVKTTI